MRKFNFAWLKSIVVILFMLPMAACSSGDEDNPQNPSNNPSEFDTNSIDVMKKFQKGRKWMGKWISSKYNKPDYAFLSDGNVIQFGSGYNTDRGMWEYNDGEHLLSTTIGAWTWKVNIFKGTQWSGTTSSGNTYSYSRDLSWNDPDEDILIGKWINSVSDVSIVLLADKSYTLTTPEGVFKGNYKITSRLLDKEEQDWIRHISYTGELSGVMNIDSSDGYRIRFNWRSLPIQEEMEHIVHKQYYENDWVFYEFTKENI